MKRLLTLSTLLLLSIMTFAQTLVKGIYYEFSGTEATVVSGTNKYTGDVIIPPSVSSGGKNYSVANIGQYAFNGCSGVTSITIPNSVIMIDVGAFSGCLGLTSVTIGNSVETIETDVFYGCSGLASITVESANSKYDSRNNCNAIIETALNTLIQGCKNTVIPNSVTRIDDFAFSNCSSGLTSITIPNSVTSIGDYAFYGCSGLTSITIPNSVTSIGKEAYRDCSSLQKVIVPDIAAWCGISFSGSAANPLYYAHHLYSDDNTEITELVIPDGVTSIGRGAFSSCSGLTSVEIPNSVTSIGSNAFSGCSGLTSITIPNSVTSIGGYAFSGCSGLTAIYSYIENPTSDTGSSFDNSNYTNATLYVPFGTKDKYLATSGWKNFTNIVEMSPEIEPIEDDTVIEFDDKDYIVDNTPIDLNNTVINDMYISMDNKSDVNNPDGFYDSTEKCIVINKATSASAIATAVASDLGSSDFINNYTGIVIEVNGKGSVKINAQTVGNNKLAVKIGSDDAKIYTLASKGDETINYDVTENTYVYIYAVDADNQQQSLSMDITDTSDNAVKVYYVTVTPDATAIETVTEADIPTAVFGKVYSIDGKQLSQPQKGLNILKMSDGTTIKVLKD